MSAKPSASEAQRLVSARPRRGRIAVASSDYANTDFETPNPPPRRTTDRGKAETKKGD